MPAQRGSRRRRDALLGLAVVLPIALVGLLVYVAASAAAGVALRIVAVGESLGLHGTLAAVGLLVAVAVAIPLLLLGVGVAVRHGVGHRAVSVVDGAIVGLPAVGPIYRGLRRSRDAIAGEGEAFREVVRVELAGGVHALGFLVARPAAADAGESEDEPAPDSTPDAEDGRVARVLATDGDAEDLVTVFLPFAPNPTVGGHLLGVSEDRVRPTGLSVAEGLGILVGLGPQREDTETDLPLATFYAPVGDDGAESAEESAGGTAVNGAQSG